MPKLFTNNLLKLMSKFRQMLLNAPSEIISVRCQPIPFPVRLDLPDEVKETMSITKQKSICGIRVLRFYSPPNIGHTIEFKGHLWSVKGIHHELQIRGSSKPDQIPTVLTTYIGPIGD